MIPDTFRLGLQIVRTLPPPSHVHADAHRRSVVIGNVFNALGELADELACTDSRSVGSGVLSLQLATIETRVRELADQARRLDEGLV